MIEKQCQFQTQDEWGQYLQILHPGYKNDQLIKTASVDPDQLVAIRQIMRHMPKEDGSLYVLISALGASEYWGSNSNADWFGVDRLVHIPLGWNSMPLNQQRSVGARWLWGYPTFYGANNFMHHQNKRIERAFGTVVYVCWDSVMKRVHLICKFDRNKAQMMNAGHVLDRTEAGEFLPVSMGCRVPYDVCSICIDWNRINPFINDPKRVLQMHKVNPIKGLSVSPNDYCEHLQRSNGMLNKILDDGRLVKMINLHPRFFDLSIVYIGADKTSFILANLNDDAYCPIQTGIQKCAGNRCGSCIPSSHIHEIWSRKEKISQDIDYWFGDDIDSLDDKKVRKEEKEVNKIVRKFRMPQPIKKTSSLGKDAEILKNVTSNFKALLPALESSESDIPLPVQDEMSKHISDALSTCGSAGIIVKPREFQRIYIRAIGKPDLADELQERNIVFPEGCPAEDDFGLSGRVIPKLLSSLLPLLAQRSMFSRPLSGRVIIIAKKESPRSNEDKAEEVTTKDSPLLNKVGGVYVAYRQDLLHKMPELIKKASYDNYMLSTWFDTGVVKTASGMLNLMGPLSVAYANNAYVTKPVSDYLDGHCDHDGLQHIAALAKLRGVA